jgi:CRISPR-associated protein Csb1
MSINLETLNTTAKLLFEIPLKPLQGSRFQPAGFPNLGAATYQTKDGLNLLVESVQSMANRLEAVCWDEANQKPASALDGISYVRVEREGAYLTSSITEAHRLNSPYMLAGKDQRFFKLLKAEFGVMESGPIDRKLLAETLLKFDVGALLHGIFLAKKELAGGRLRLARALSAFIEAEGVRQAVSGGVKNDAVNPSGSAKDGFGNVPFSREEYTAEKITLFVNLDLAQIRGYGLDKAVEKLLILLALYKIRTLANGNLRLRTACDLAVASDSVTASKPSGFVLPELASIEAEIKHAIDACKKLMTVTTVTFNDEFKAVKGDSDDSEKDDTGDVEK